MKTISPREAQRLIDEGAALIDIREVDERAREYIACARHAPLSQLEKSKLGPLPGKVIFHCRSGVRTQGNSARLAAAAGEGCEAFIVEGGLEGWRKAGLPTVLDRSQPIDLQRQAQIGAGLLLWIGALLGFLVSPWFFAVPFLVGGGLLFAGLTGRCGMVLLLSRAPWNRAPCPKCG